MNKLFRGSNILLITQEFDHRAGAGVYAYELAKTLAKLGESVHVICPGSHTECESIEPAITIHRHRVINMPLLKVPAHHVQVWIRSKKIIKDSGSTIILSNNYAGAFVRRGRLPLLATIHHTAREELKNIFGFQKIPFCADILFEKLIIKRSRLLITDSHLVKHGLEKIAPKKKILVLPCGIDLQMFKKLRRSVIRKELGVPKDVLVLFCPGGTRGKRKGILDLSEALKEITIPSYRCVVTGGFGTIEAGWKSEVIRTIKKASLEDKFIFVGDVAREKLPEFYSAADIIVYPSLLEGFGLPALEALACERPFIGTRTGEMPYIIKDGYNGLLIDTGSPRQLQKSLERLINSESERKKLAANARKSIMDYSWDSLGKTVINLHKQIMQELSQ